MRLGRIILALLAPLVSLHPAFRTGVPSEHKQPTADSLANSVSALWTPLVRMEGARAHAATVQHDHALTFGISARDSRPSLLARLSGDNAQLASILRQQQRLLLRC